MQSKKIIEKQIIEIGVEILKTGLVVGTWGNISARHSHKTNLVAITPSGMDYRILKDEDIIWVDLEGKVQKGERKPSIELPLHLAVYRERSEIKGIVHVHSVYATAWAAARKSIPAALEDMVQIVGGEVRVCDYALPGTERLGVNVAKSLDNRQAVLLANHGLLGVGKDLNEALKVCQVVEKAAQSLLAAQALGGAVELSQEDIDGMRSFYLDSYGQR